MDKENICVWINSLSIKGKHKTSQTFFYGKVVFWSVSSVWVSLIKNGGKGSKRGEGDGSLGCSRLLFILLFLILFFIFWLWSLRLRLRHLWLWLNRGVSDHGGTIGVSFFAIKRISLVNETNFRGVFNWFRLDENPTLKIVVGSSLHCETLATVVGYALWIEEPIVIIFDSTWLIDAILSSHSKVSFFPSLVIAIVLGDINSTAFVWNRREEKIAWRIDRPIWFGLLGGSVRSWSYRSASADFAVQRPITHFL